MISLAADIMQQGTLKQFKVGPVLLPCDSIFFHVRPHSCQHQREHCMRSSECHTLGRKMPHVLDLKIILSLSKMELLWDGALW